MRRCATITIGDVMKKKISVCENSMVLVYILAMSGGFMDAYSYMCRGEVFANAQTGNILLMAVNLAKGNFVVALRYFAPVMAFIAGVVLAQTVHHIFKGRALQRSGAVCFSVFRPEISSGRRVLVLCVRGQRGGSLCGGIYTV